LIRLLFRIQSQLRLSQTPTQFASTASAGSWGRLFAMTEVTLKVLPPDAIATQVVGGTATNFVFAFWEDAPFLPDPVFALQLWYQSTANAKWFHFSDPKVDADITAGANMNTLPARTSCIQAAEKDVDALAPVVNVVAPDFIYAVTDKVSGANFNYGLSYVVDTMSIAP